MRLLEKTRRDEAVSELLGYAVLMGVVVIAAISISVGAGDTILSCVRNAELAEAIRAVDSFSLATAQSIATDSEYPEALEVVVPQGYDLALVDRGDDWRTLTIKVGGSEVTKQRPGSLSLQSAFRTVSFEGGGVFVNDTGVCRCDKVPSVFVASSPGGATSLYICVSCLSADTAVLPAGRKAVLSVRCRSLQDYSWTVPAGTPVSVEIRTACPAGWKQALENGGFTVSVTGDTVTGSRGGIDSVCLTTAELCVGLE